MKADKKNRIHVVYSTDPNYNYEYNNETEDETLPPEKQNLRVMLDSKQRKGKTVTLVQGFVGREDELKELAKLLKNKCGRRDHHSGRSERKSPEYPPGKLIPGQIKVAPLRSSDFINSIFL